MASYVMNFITKATAHHHKMQEFDDVDDSNVWYFAFGSNMNVHTMITRRQIQPAESVPAYLEDYCLMFNIKTIPWVEPVMANIEKREGSVLHGVAHRISYKQWCHLQRTEGIGAGNVYEVISVPITCYDKRKIKAFAFICTQKRFLVNDEVPSLRYLTLLRQGAQEHALSEEYRSYLYSLQVNKVNIAWMLLLFFVLMMMTPTFFFMGLLRILGFSNRYFWVVLHYLRDLLWIIRVNTRTLGHRRKSSSAQ